jgi:3-oxoacyl-[acyl-carrier-protein] synthase III
MNGGDPTQAWIPPRLSGAAAGPVAEGRRPTAAFADAPAAAYALDATHRDPLSLHPGLATPLNPMARFTVAGWGTALPEQIITNHHFARYLDTSDEWITSRTGIRERRIGAPTESTGPLAVAAARRALDHAGVDIAEIDVIAVATTTPERPIPSTAAGVAAALGSSAGAFDLNAACAGFIYGLTVAGGLLETGTADTILLVGADTMSRYVDPDDRGTVVLFGDAAGAVVLRGPGQLRDSPDAGVPGGLLACDLIDDPDACELLVVPAGGSAEPATLDTVRRGRHFLQMDGNEVFRRAVRAVADSVTRTLVRAGCESHEIDLFIPHQANARIIEAVLPRVGLTGDRTVQTVDHHGNTSAASVPLALSEAAAAGRLGDGNLVVMSGFGAGMTVGTAAIRWRTSRPDLSGGAPT